MVTYGTFTIVDISDGAQWYSGTSITNTSTTPTIFPNSGVLYAVEGDMYLNISTQNTYRCVEDGDASHAKWVYVNNIKGEDGVGITSIVSQYCLSNDSTSTSTHPHDGTWGNDVPPYEENKYYWTRQYVTWDNGSHSYSPSEDGVLDNSLTDANRNAYEANNKDVAYQGVCNTGETVGTKVVTSNNFVLSDGTVITVLFTAPNKSTGLIQLNVNDTGNKDVYVGGTATGSTNSNILLWGANAQITFVYNSNHWVVSGEPRTWHGNCPSTVSAGISEKTITISEVVICKGTTIVANMANGNTSTTPSLNITALGAINLYYGTGTNTPTLANGYGWTDNSTTQFVFDGLYWRMADSSTSEKTNDARKVASNYLSSDSTGIMIADLSNGNQTPLQATGRNVFINNTSVNIRDGQSELAVFGADGITLGGGTDKNIKIDNNNGIDIRVGTESLANFNDIVRIGKIVYDRPYATVDNQGMNILISRGADTRKLISLGALYGSNMNENMGHRISTSFTYTLLYEPALNSSFSLALVYQSTNPTPTIIDCFTQGVATSRTSTTAPSVILDYVDIDGTNYPCGYLDYDGDRTFTYVANNPIYHEEPTGEIVDGEEEYAEVETYWTSFLTPTVFYSTGDTTSGGYITNGTRLYNAPIGENTLTNGTELIASSRDQIVVGRYNEADSGDENAIIVGDGNSEQRHNSFTVGRGGNVFVAGGLDVAGNITQGGTAVSLQGHSHNASAITTGTLPIERGGSGNNKTYSTTVISDVCTSASGWSVTQAQYCSWGKVATIHLAITKNNTAGSGIQTLCTLKSGKRPKFSSPAQYGWHDCAIVGTDGTIQISDSVAANTIVQIRATYVLA